MVIGYLTCLIQLKFIAGWDQLNVGTDAVCIRGTHDGAIANMNKYAPNLEDDVNLVCFSWAVEL